MTSPLARDNAYEQAALGFSNFLDAREGELLDLACRLIATPSPNPPGDERAAARLVTERLLSWESRTSGNWHLKKPDRT